MRAALRRYAVRLRSTSLPPAPPEFYDGLAAECDQIASLELPLDRETLATLERQARASSTSVEEVASHAVLLYLAELDAVKAITLRGARE